jgi:hypothetical protein
MSQLLVFFAEPLELDRHSREFSDEPRELARVIIAISPHRFRMTLGAKSPTVPPRSSASAGAYRRHWSITHLVELLPRFCSTCDIFVLRGTLSFAASGVPFCVQRFALLEHIGQGAKIGRGESLELYALAMLAKYRRRLFGWEDLYTFALNEVIDRLPYILEILRMRAHLLGLGFGLGALGLGALELETHMPLITNAPIERCQIWKRRLALFPFSHNELLDGRAHIFNAITDEKFVVKL